jgi:ATP-dependent Clp protease adaptor protein ClpS
METSVAEPRIVHEDVAADAPESTRPWKVIVFDDPINLMTYVTYVFQKLFGYPFPQAHELMLQVHTTGKAVVASGPRERCELDVSRLHAHGLWASMERD